MTAPAPAEYVLFIGSPWGMVEEYALLRGLGRVRPNQG
jgi:hypothetical protein